MVSNMCLNHPPDVLIQADYGMTMEWLAQPARFHFCQSEEMESPSTVLPA